MDTGRDKQACRYRLEQVGIEAVREGSRDDCKIFQILGNVGICRGGRKMKCCNVLKEMLRKAFQCGTGEKMGQ